MVDMFRKYSGFRIGLSLRFCDCFENCRVSRQTGPVAGSMNIYMGLFAHLAIAARLYLETVYFVNFPARQPRVSLVTGSLSETKILFRSKDKTTLYCMMWWSHSSG